MTAFIFRLFLFAKIYSIKNLLNKIDKALEMYEEITLYLKLFYLLTFILKLAHLMACLYHVLFFLQNKYIFNRL